MKEFKDTSEQRSTFDMVQDGIITEIVEERPKGRGNRYGKLIVLASTRLCMISIGPDCTELFSADCMFVPAFAFFVTVGFFLTRLVWGTSENMLFRTLTLLVCGLQPLAYLLTALIDPGVVT